ncbi:hypothetical protein [Ignatzschineria indica]|uniref:hypothetical protein n=1 Tax=Ignatzschineria indica TaxID=472583 RepID=UPI003645E9C0
MPEEAITKSIDNHIENHDTYLESIEETQNIDKSETTINQIHEEYKLMNIITLQKMKIRA